MRQKPPHNSVFTRIAAWVARPATRVRTATLVLAFATATLAPLEALGCLEGDLVAATPTATPPSPAISRMKSSRDSIRRVNGARTSRGIFPFAQADAVLQQLADLGYPDVDVYVREHNDRPLLYIRFVAHNAEAQHEACVILAALAQTLSLTVVRYVAIADGLFSPLTSGGNFDYAFWRSNDGRWRFVGSEHNDFFEEVVSQPVTDATDMALRIESRLQLALVNRSDYVRRRLLRGTYDEMQKTDVRPTLQLQVVTALLGDAVMNREEELAASSPEVVGWVSRYIAQMRAANVAIGDGPLFVVAPVFLPKCNGTVRIAWDILPTGLVANARAEDIKMPVICAKSWVEALSRWRFLPMTRDGAATTVQRSDTFSSTWAASWGARR